MTAKRYSGAPGTPSGHPMRMFWTWIDTLRAVVAVFVVLVCARGTKLD